MEAILIAGAASIITQLAKKTGWNPQWIAAIVALVIAFFTEGYQAIVAGSLDWSNLASFLTVAGTAWTSSIGYFEVISKNLGSSSSTSE